MRPEAERLIRDKNIKQEIYRLKKLYKHLGKDNSKVVEGLISEAAFMKITLEETRETLSKEGMTEVFEQGSQKFIRKHPLVDVYNTLINRYTAVMKILIDLLTLDDKTKEADALMNFVKKKAAVKKGAVADK